MNKKLIIGISAAVAAVIIGAAAALMTSTTPEKIDLSSTHTTEAPSESQETEAPTETEVATVAEEPSAEAGDGEAAAASVTASIKTYSSGEISIEYPEIQGLSDSDLLNQINEKLRLNALSVIQGMGLDEANDSLSVKCQVISVDRRRLTAVYTGLATVQGAAYPTNLFYSNTVDLKDGSDLGLGDFTDAYTMAGYVLSDDVVFSGLTDEQTAAVLEYRKSLTLEDLTNTLNQADFPIQTGVQWPPSFSYETQGSIYFTIPVDHALGDYVTVRFDPSTK